MTFERLTGSEFIDWIVVHWFTSHGQTKNLERAGIEIHGFDSRCVQIGIKTAHSKYVIPNPQVSNREALGLRAVPLNTMAARGMVKLLIASGTAALVCRRSVRLSSFVRQPQKTPAARS